ncbi:hypothetical protein DAPPUDRAFT_307974 [Daphnia pulex]|uniref:FAS1 domain-containing protein n=1 Tax=Daphnia pulex TaxID=6669 RepID=E9H585_DAPPU|nr:hypothetical protein DAPPUDRAFT_307974 [Daphnia pulex]|eukprot:EFX73084.1 hypothetical protein DAPPUDRAFT_307974 [Daphnia pulex]
MCFFAIVAAYAIISSLADAYTPTNKYTEFIEWNRNSSQTADIPIPTGNILTVLTENGFTTFVDLIIKSGLEETFSQPGPFVVWAPTNEAFSAIDRETFNSILIDSSLLKDILTYHLTLFGQPYTLISAIKDELARPTVQGQVVRINVYRKKGSSFASKRSVTVNGALVVNTFSAGESIIYVINRVLNPQDLDSRNTKINYLRRHPEFSIFLKISDTLGFSEDSFKSPMKTVFVPTNAAFQALPVSELEALFDNKQALLILFNTYTASGTFYSQGLVSGPLPVFSGDNIDINITPGGISIENANIIKADITTVDGVIHIIDAVISHRVEDSTISSDIENHFFIKQHTFY